MRKPSFAVIFALAALTAIALALVLQHEVRVTTPVPPPQAPSRTYTLQERIDEIGPGARARLRQKFQTANAPWPPTEATFVVLKDQAILELYARTLGTAWTLVHRYPVLKASGRSGPKLKYGDYQVPEGVYRIEYLNPNSRYHVSLKLDYPNAFDREMAAKDGRTDLGGDIMIHGKAASAGCLAMGDEASEELFVLASAITIKNVTAIIAPADFRTSKPEPGKGSPPWLPKLYAEIDRELKIYRTH
jgi:L,D-transpeptidase catalytic domain